MCLADYDLEELLEEAIVQAKQMDKDNDGQRDEIISLRTKAYNSLLGYNDEEIIAEGGKRVAKCTKQIEYLKEELKRYRMAI